MAGGKRILGVVASLRPGGNSEMLTRLALETVAARGAETDIVYLRDLRIGFCDGCLSCVFGEGGCHHGDDVAWLFTTAHRYDGLILASPTYLLSAPGQVKALVDRGVAELARSPGRREIPVGVICVAGLPGWDYLVRPMVNQLGFLLGGKLAGSVLGHAPGPGETLLDEPLLEKVRDLANAVYDDRRLPAPEGVCPVCYLERPVKAEAGGGPDSPGGDSLACPFCRHDPSRPDVQHRFTTASLLDFLMSWMLPSRERFLAHRHEVKAAVAKLGQGGPAGLGPAIGRLRPERPEPAGGG